MKKRLANWLIDKTTHDHVSQQKTHPWYHVMWLTGVDYFSSIAYQAGISLIAAGILAPIATFVLSLVTLCCCVPVYCEVSKRSHAGQGSIAMLENLLPKWWGKFVVLLLLGLACTDFIITMTLSAADAVCHMVQNPFLHGIISESHHIGLTCMLLACLAIVFLRGVKEAIILAMLAGIPYILLNIVIIGYGLYEIATHPFLIIHFEHALKAQGSWGHIMAVSILVFPGLALGLSGFETGVSVMPLIKSEEKDITDATECIRNTKKMLILAAMIMCVILLFSSIVTTLLIPPEAYQPGGEASGRAMAYLGHRLLGEIFGSIYDFSTIMILWFAGASAMAGMLNLIPRYLPRFGMAPQWVAYRRPLILIIFGITVFITLLFRADVDRQAGAYATGVLALILSAALAATIVIWQEQNILPNISLYKKYGKVCYYGIIAFIFAYTLVMNSLSRPDGIIIATIFSVVLIIVGIISRYQRATELRVIKCTLHNAHSQELWNEIRKIHVNLIPIPSVSHDRRVAQEHLVRKHYTIEGPLAFIHVSLLDNRSDFLEELKVKIRKENEHYIIEVSQANVIANSLAYMSIELRPKALFIGLTRRNLMNQSLRYLVYGVGEIGLRVYEILIHYWKDKPSECRPFLFMMSK